MIQQQQQDEERRRQEEELAAMSYDERVDYYYANPPEPGPSRFDARDFAPDGRPLLMNTGHGWQTYEQFVKEKA